MKKLFSLVSSAILALGWLLLIPVPVAHAANICTWTGGSSANWSDTGNWTGCGGTGVPVDGDVVSLPAVAGNKTMSNDIAGTLTLDQLNIYNGYTLTGNSIVISSAMHFQSTGSSVNLTSLDFDNASTGVSLQIDGTGNTIATSVGINLPSGDFNAYVNANFTAPAFTGSMTNFNKWGTATFTAASGSTFTTAGGVNLEAGSFACASSSCAGNSANGIAQYSGGILEFNGNVTFSNAVTLNYLNGANAVGIQVDDTFGVSMDGGVSMNGPAQAQVGSGSAFQVLGSNSITDTFELLGNSASTSDFNNTGTATGSGEFSCSNITCNMQANISTFDGVIRGKAGSIIHPELDDSLGSTVGGTVIEDGAMLLFEDGSDITTPENISVVGTGISSSGAIRNEDTAGDRTLSGTVTLAGDTMFYSQDLNGIAPGANLNFSGKITGTGSPTLTTSGLTASINLTGSTSNDFVGTTYVNNGEVSLDKNPGTVAVPHNMEINSTGSNFSQVIDNAGGQLSSTSKVTFSEDTADHAAWQVGADETIGSISGLGSISIISPQTLHTGGDDASTTFSGVVAGGGTLHKIGTGTLTLTGTNTVTGMIVTAGKLLVNGDSSASPVTVEGGTLGGNGSIGDSSIATGGTLNVGNSPGCMTFASLGLNNGSNFVEDIAGNTACTEYDQTTVTSAISLGDATLNINLSITPAVGSVYTIIQAGSVTGTFNGLPEGATVSVNGVQFRINYTGTTVTLTYIGGSLAPTGQNTSWINIVATLLILSSAAGLLIVWRRKHLFPNQS